MTVVSIAFLEVYFCFLVALTGLVAACSYWVPTLVYVNAGLLLVMLYLLIVSIPLKLNWSREMYAGLLRRQLFFVVYTAFIYAIHFYLGGIAFSDQQPASPLDALYFSFTTWTTLGYGDITVTRHLRLATSLEALTGVLTVAMLTATIWLYCQDRLWPVPTDAKRYNGLQLRLNDVTGVWHEIESEQVSESKKRRAERISLRDCPECGRAPIMEKFFDITGRLAPFAMFSVVCECGAHSKPRRNVYLAEEEWNRYGPAKPEHKTPSLAALVAFRLVLVPSRALFEIRKLFAKLKAIANALRK